GLRPRSRPHSPRLLPRLPAPPSRPVGAWSPRRASAPRLPPHPPPAPFGRTHRTPRPPLTRRDDPRPPRGHPRHVAVNVPARDRLRREDRSDADRLRVLADWPPPVGQARIVAAQPVRPRRAAPPLQHGAE